MSIKNFYPGFSLILVLALVLSVHCQSGESQGSTASRCVTKPISMPAAGTFAGGPDRLFLGTAEGAVVALDSRSLEVLWRAELGGDFVSDLIVVEGGAAVVTNARTSETAGNSESRLTMLSSESGVPAWTASLPYHVQYYVGKINGSIATVAPDGTVMIFDRAGGRLKRKFIGNSHIAARPHFSPSGLVFVTEDKEIYVLSPDLRESSVKQMLEFKPISVLSTRDGGIAAGDARGNLAVFGPGSSRPLWRFKSGGAVTSIAETDEGLLVTSLDNFVYLLSDYNGDVIWKKRLTGRLLEGGLLLGDVLVVSINGENSVFVIELVKGKLLDELGFSGKELMSRTPIAVGDRSFALTTANTVEVYAFGGCGQK